MSEIPAQSESRTAIAVLLAVLGLVAFFVGYVVISAQARARGVGFHEGAQEAGISFVMRNLPSEQGEQRFRINLYDHGAGLAIGDFDNDGRDDIYFLNQHGPNALYRNKGDGKFEDVTAKAGVALEGKVSVGATFTHTDKYFSNHSGDAFFAACEVARNP